MGEGDATSGTGATEAENDSVDLPTELQAPSKMTAAIYAAIDAQRPAAVSYVRSIRRRQMTTTPAEILSLLERHYLVSVTASGTAVGAAAFIPGAGTAVALGAGAAELLLQFELAALFGLASSEIHGLKIPDRDRARALILTLMLGQEGRTKVAGLAKAAIRKDPTAMAGITARTGQLAGVGSLDDLPLGELLGSAVPGDMMPSILDAAQNLARDRLPEKAKAAGTRLIPGGIGMMLGGIGGFTTGNDVIQAAKQAFGAAPERLPEWLEPIDSDGDGAPDPTAFETGMRNALGKFVEVSGGAVEEAGGGISIAAAAVGGGVTAAAAGVSRPFRSVDLDGDGIPDEARAVTAAKDVSRVAVGAAGAVRGSVTSLFKRKQDRDDATDTPADDESITRDGTG